MAGNIKGITVEIGGNTTKLQKALTDVNKVIKTSGKDLKDINKLLKLDPGNTVLLTQKQQALKNSIQATKEKLQTLKDASKQVTPEQIGQEKYDALQREIAETEAQLKGLEQEYKNFGSVQAQQLKIAGQKMEELGTKISSAGRTLTTYVTAPIVGAGAVAVKTSADFESSMSNVAAISGATGNDLQALKEKAREMGATTKFSATESADAMSYMAMAGWDADQMISGLPGILNLAAASGEDLATTSDIVTDALTAFGMKAEDSGHFADIMAAASSNANTNVSLLGESFKYAAPVAGALGYSAEDTSIALGLMANAGIKASQGGTALRNVLTNMAKPTKDSETAMARLGISLSDADGNMYSFREIMDQLRGSFGEINMPVEEFNRQVNELDSQLEAGEITQTQYDNALEELTKQAYGAEGAEKARAAAMLAGKNGMSGLLAIVNASEEDYNKLTAAVDGCSDVFVKTADGSIKTMNQALEDGDEIIETYNGAAEKTASVMGDNLNGKLTILKSSLQELAISFGETLTPAIEKVIEIVQGIITKLNGLSDTQRKVISIIAGVIAAVGPVLLVVGNALIFAGKITTAIAALQPVLAAAGAAIAGIAGPIAIAIAAIGAIIAVGVLLYQNWDTIKLKMAELKEWLALKWEEAKTSVTTVVENVRTAVSTKFEEMKAAVQEKINAAMTAISTTFENIRTTIQTKVELARATVQQKFEQIKTGIQTRINAAKTAVTTTFENIRSSIQSKIELARSTVATKIDAIKQKLSSIVPSSITNKFEQIRSGIQSKMEAARSVVTSAIERIKSAFNFSWSLPQLKLPHISVSGGVPPYGIGGMGSLPHFSIAWYKKAVQNPYILEGAQIFGAMGGKALGGGEAGRELIVGWDSLKRHMGGDTTNNINITINAAKGMDERQIADTVMRRIQQEVNSRRSVWA